MGRSRFTVTVKEAGERLDVFLSRRLSGFTRSRIRKLIDGGHVRHDDLTPKAGSLLRAGSTVTIDVPPPEPSGTFPEPIPLNVLFEDGDLIVIDKPPHMVVHPAHGHSSGTLVNALLFHCRDLSGIGGVTRPGIVHRLDKGTSGVMVAAKNDAAHVSLARQFKDHTIGRTYLAAVKGEVGNSSGLIEKPLGRRPKDRKRIGVREDGRRAVTNYEVIGRRAGISLVRLSPGTGRTHQLRVHLASIGHPILGDPTYGGSTRSLHGGAGEGACLAKNLTRPALHALELAFDHPSTGKRMAFEAPPPGDLTGLFEWIRGEKP
jgi:23S rRNA pseudouridine1911/1915/1917 synthase